DLKVQHGRGEPPRRRLDALGLDRDVQRRCRRTLLLQDRYHIDSGARSQGGEQHVEGTRARLRIAVNVDLRSARTVCLELTSRDPTHFDGLVSAGRVRASGHRCLLVQGKGIAAPVHILPPTKVGENLRSARLSYQRQVRKPELLEAPPESSALLHLTR